MMLFMLLFSRQGKLRLQKWYVAHPDKVKKKITRELITTILARSVNKSKPNQIYRFVCDVECNSLIFIIAENQKCARSWNGRIAKLYIRG